jgi:Caspase domain
MGASRVALVVGTAAYKQSELQLANPENDAKAMGSFLSNDCAFTVTLLLSPTKHEVSAIKT